MAASSAPAARQPPDHVTHLLRAWRTGDDSALDRLVPIVHAELRRLARRQMRRERHDHTLQTTALVNEVYLRLVDLSSVKWQDRAHFFAMASRLMRHVLVDYARSRRYLKRGGGALRLSLTNALGVGSERDADVVALDDALKALADIDVRKSRVVELRFFGGFSVAETAEAIGVSEETIQRDWRMAKAWLLKELANGA